MAESEYEGLYSDCTMNSGALYENTWNNVVRGILTNTNGNTIHVTASDTCTYSVLGPTCAEFNQPSQFSNQTVFEDEYSCLQHKWPP